MLDVNLEGFGIAVEPSTTIVPPIPEIGSSRR
jgi:hypothetical protein